MDTASPYPRPFGAEAKPTVLVELTLIALNQSPYGKGLDLRPHRLRSNLLDIRRDDETDVRLTYVQ